LDADEVIRNRLTALTDYVRAHPGEPHTLITLAKRAGMSRSTFVPAFRQHFGRSPMELLRTIRLDHAARLLRTTAIPVKNIGVSAGYKSRTSFSMAFQRAFGVSPADFRAAATRAERDDIHVVAQRLRELSGDAQHLAWEVDIATGAVWWSEGMFAALGYGPGKHPVSDVSRLYARIHVNDRERVVRGVLAAATGGDLTWQDAYRFKRFDGTFVRTENACVILRNRGGAAIRLIGVMRLSGNADDPLHAGASAS
jgi:AraC-like DNA-binding protein